MVPMNAHASPCVVIGDLVGSRTVPDRREVHRTLEKALVAVNAAVPARTELRVTAGDEFQGSYATLGGAIDAALRVRLELLPTLDARFGIGRGTVLILDAERGIEDGPGWWAARAAIEEIEERAERAPLRALRTAFHVADPDAHERAQEQAVNAALQARDHLIGDLGERSLRLLRGLLDPHTTQSDMAAVEGISPSAVSQRVRADGLGVLILGHETLGVLP